MARVSFIDKVAQINWNKIGSLLYLNGINKRLNHPHDRFVKGEIGELIICNEIGGQITNTENGYDFTFSGRKVSVKTIKSNPGNLALKNVMGTNAQYVLDFKYLFCVYMTRNQIHIKIFDSDDIKTEDISYSTDQVKFKYNGISRYIEHKTIEINKDNLQANSKIYDKMVNKLLNKKKKAYVAGAKAAIEVF